MRNTGILYSSTEHMPDNTEKLKWLYRHFAPQHDPDGFRLYSAAQEVTGIKRLWEEFPYEDACGRFEFADGRQLLRYLTAAYFRAVSWEIVPYVLKCIRNIMNRNQLCIAPP